MVDLLISKGADVMIRDKDGVTPLMSAASQVRHPFVMTAATTLHGPSPI